MLMAIKESGSLLQNHQKWSFLVFGAPKWRLLAALRQNGPLLASLTRPPPLLEVSAEAASEAAAYINDLCVLLKMEVRTLNSGL